MNDFRLSALDWCLSRRKMFRYSILMAMFAGSVGWPLSSKSNDQLTEALHLKQAFIENNQFIEALPVSLSGRAEGVSRSLSTNFSSHSPATVRGVIDVASLAGGIRLKVATTSDPLYFSKQIRVDANITVTQGGLSVFSPVDLDFWSMAALFVDGSKRNRPADVDLELKGFTQYLVRPGETLSVQLGLVPIGGDYMLLIAATDADAKGIRIVLQ